MMIAGYLLSFGSFLRIKDLMSGNAIPFVLNVTAGNLIALAGSCFLSGPKTQYHKMWHPTRRLATGMYFGSLVLTIFLAFAPIPGPKGFVLILLMFCQYLASKTNYCMFELALQTTHIFSITVTWYCLSYIPFAREWIASYAARRWGAANSQ
jgi:hypothetical protein